MLWPPLHHLLTWGTWKAQGNTGASVQKKAMVGPHFCYGRMALPLLVAEWRRCKASTYADSHAETCFYTTPCFVSYGFDSCPLIFVYQIHFFLLLVGPCTGFWYLLSILPSPWLWNPTCLSTKFQQEMPLWHWNGKRKQGVKTSHPHSNKKCIFSFFKIHNGFLKRGADFEWKCRFWFSRSRQGWKC